MHRACLWERNTHDATQWMNAYDWIESQDYLLLNELEILCEMLYDVIMIYFFFSLNVICSNHEVALVTIAGSGSSGLDDRGRWTWGERIFFSFHIFFFRIFVDLLLMKFWFLVGHSIGIRRNWIGWWWSHSPWDWREANGNCIIFVQLIFDRKSAKSNLFARRWPTWIVRTKWHPRYMKNTWTIHKVLQSKVTNLPPHAPMPHAFSFHTKLSYPFSRSMPQSALRCWSCVRS